MGRATVVYASSADGKPVSGHGTAARAVYAFVADPEVQVPAEAVACLRAELDLARPPVGRSLEDLVAEVRVWSEDLAARFARLPDATDTEGRRVLAHRAALSCAPLCLAMGAWLQWLSGPGNADDPSVLDVLALYAGDVGVGYPGVSRGSIYLGLLRRLGLSEHAVPLRRLTADQRVSDLAFRLPALLLAISRRPEDFRGELLGADLCLRSHGMPLAVGLVREVLPAAVDWDGLDPARARFGEEETPLALSRRIATAFAATRPEADVAVRTGFAWTLAALRTWTEQQYDELRESSLPAYEMAELLRLRAREGSVYHQDFSLEGKPLSTWLTEARADPGPLLAALTRSRLVRPGDAASSPLVNGLVSERGRMFRVFSNADLAVIRRWIDSLDPDGNNPRMPEWSAAGVHEPVAVAEALRRGPTDLGRAPTSVREAYHRLMTRTDSPALRSWSHSYVTGWLARSRFGMDERTMPLPRRWDSAGLRPWLQAQHDRHSVEFEENADIPLPSRDAVIDDTLQTAPLTLIDGSWLHGFCDYELAPSEIGHSLFETYWDELGNGLARLNHPLLYRQVLREMDIDLPPTASPEFAHWPGLRDKSFELPVYWLCVGRFPRTFLPEVLGLNLAMELSGVGGSYRRARLALRKYGFNTRFVDIHNTIDNVATGHAAWAADAIDTLLATLPDTPFGERDRVWDRVRTGFRSLTPPDGVRARRAARRAKRASPPLELPA